MAPLPGPNTLRMGEQNPAGIGHDSSESSPLMRAIGSETHGTDIQEDHKE